MNDQNKNINVAIVTGGDSSEVVISLKSAAEVRKILDMSPYTPYIVDIRKTDWHLLTDNGEKIPIDRNDFGAVVDNNKIHFDFAFLAMHGTPGEDGKLQAYFDLLGIPYSSPGVLSLALSFNKFTCKSFLGNFGIPTARSVVISEKERPDPDKIISLIGLPCIIKPNCGGSSFGISKIDRREQLEEALKKARNEDDLVIIEEYLRGTEITSGLVKFQDEEMIFPVTEVISKKEFFDYEAKYIKGMSEEYTPARVDDDIALACQQLSSRIYDLLNCHGIVRIDYIISGGEPYFLELNGIPGMTQASIVPQQIRACGSSELDVYCRIIEEGLKP